MYGYKSWPCKFAAKLRAPRARYLLANYANNRRLDTRNERGFLSGPFVPPFCSCAFVCSTVSIHGSAMYAGEKRKRFSPGQSPALLTDHPRMSGITPGNTRRLLKFNRRDETFREKVYLNSLTTTLTVPKRRCELQKNSIESK